jgi:hypothetical protein
MDTGTRTGIVYLADDGSDAVTAYRTSIRNLAAWAETQGALYAQGLLSARPAAGKAGRLYRATDDSAGVIYYDDGSTWSAIGTSAVVDAAANVGSLRTLGAGALQAAAGNHTHAIGAITGTGDSVTKNVGATAGTVAAGDHTHAVVQGTQSVIKGSATLRSNTITVTSDPDITLSMTAGTYRITSLLAAPGPNGIGIQIRWTTTGSVTFLQRACIGPVSTTQTKSIAGSPSGSIGTGPTLSTIVNYGTDYGSVPFIQESLLLTWSGSGSVTLQWAPNTNSVQNVAIDAGSALIAERLA